MKKRLYVRRSKHGDQWFAVQGSSKMYEWFIVKIFYNLNNCEEYVYEYNIRLNDETEITK